MLGPSISHPVSGMRERIEFLEVLLREMSTAGDSCGGEPAGGQVAPEARQFS